MGFNSWLKGLNETCVNLLHKPFQQRGHNTQNVSESCKITPYQRYFSFGNVESQILFKSLVIHVWTQHYRISVSESVWYEIQEISYRKFILRRQTNPILYREPRFDIFCGISGSLWTKFDCRTALKNIWIISFVPSPHDNSRMYNEPCHWHNYAKHLS
jgi:hypothetical protein